MNSRVTESASRFRVLVEGLARHDLAEDIGELKNAPIGVRRFAHRGEPRRGPRGVVTGERVRDHVRQHDGELVGRQLRAIDEPRAEQDLAPWKAIGDGLFAGLDVNAPRPSSRPPAPSCWRTRSAASTSGGPRRAVPYSCRAHALHARDRARAHKRSRRPDSLSPDRRRAASRPARRCWRRASALSRQAQPRRSGIERSESRRRCPWALTDYVTRAEEPIPKSRRAVRELRHKTRSEPRDSTQAYSEGRAGSRARQSYRAAQPILDRF